MISGMTTRSRRQQRHDHRLRELVQRTGNTAIATALGVPRSTARGWLVAAPNVVVSPEGDDLTDPELRQKILKLRRRVEKPAGSLAVQLIRSELGSHPFTPCIPAEMEGGCNGDQSRRRSFGMHDLSHAGDNRVGAIEGPIAVTFSRRGPDQLRAGPASEGSIGGRRAPGTLECDGVATATANREIGRHSVGGSDRRGRRCNRRIGATDSQQR
jgi:hypothetical protein